MYASLTFRVSRLDQIPYFTKNGEMLEYRLSLYPNFTLNLTLKSPHLESDLGNEFFEPGLPCEVIFMPKI